MRPVPFAALALALCAAAPAHPDFTGTWKLDLAASDPLDDLLDAQGAPWVAKKAAKTLVVTQKVALKPEGLEVCAESSLRSKCTIAKIGAGWEDRETEQGKGRARTDWSADGTALITVTEAKLKDGTPVELRMTRTLEDAGKTTVQLLELKAKDGKAHKARRVLRKQD